MEYEMTEKIYKELTEYLLSMGFRNFNQETIIDGKEVDFTCEKETWSKKFIRKYIFELKESDFNKVLIQAHARMHLADYVYIVIVRMPLAWFCYKMGEHFKKIKENNIGVLYYYNDDFHEVVRPKMQRSE